MDRRAYLTSKKREAREKARAAGRCIICTRNIASAGLATCAGCRKAVTETRRSYQDFVTAVYETVRARAGEGACVQHHQPADRMVEFTVSVRSDVLRRVRRLPWYVWRDVDPDRVAEDVMLQYEALLSDVREAALS